MQTFAMPVCFCQVDIGMSYRHLIMLETDFLDGFEILQCSCCTMHEQIIVTAAIVFLCMFAFPVQRASFFAAADENHRPVSAASSSDQAEDQLTAQIKPYTG